MARELVNLTNQNEEILEKIEELPLLKKQYEVKSFTNFEQIYTILMSFHKPEFITYLYIVCLAYLPDLLVIKLDCFTGAEPKI